MGSNERANAIVRERAIDYVMKLPEMTVSTLERVVLGAHDSPRYGFVSEADHAEYKRMVEEIVRRCNQYMPLVRRYKALLDEVNRDVSVAERNGAGTGSERNGAGTGSGRNGAGTGSERNGAGTGSERNGAVTGSGRNGATDLKEQQPRKRKEVRAMGKCGGKKGGCKGGGRCK